MRVCIKRGKKRGPCAQVKGSWALILCASIHKYIKLYIQEYIQTYIHIYIYACIHKHISTNTHVYKCIYQERKEEHFTYYYYCTTQTHTHTHTHTYTHMKREKRACSTCVVKDIRPSALILCASLEAAGRRDTFA